MVHGGEWIGLATPQCCACACRGFGLVGVFVSQSFMPCKCNGEAEGKKARDTSDWFLTHVEYFLNTRRTDLRYVLYKSVLLELI